MRLFIGKFFDVPLYIHWTWFLFVGIWTIFNGPIGALVLFWMFFYVILHEYGHVRAAQKLGVRVLDVIMLPIGAVARIFFIPNRPKEELLVSLAGPAVNLVLAIFFGIGLFVVSFFENDFLDFLFGISLFFNLAIALFNLLPILPMDGGRVLRAILTSRTNYLTATKISVKVGQVLCVVGFVLSIFFIQPILCLILILMFVMAQNELFEAQGFAILQEIRENVAIVLKQPELVDVSIPQLITAIEDTATEDQKAILEADKLLPLLKDISANR